MFKPQVTTRENCLPFYSLTERKESEFIRTTFKSRYRLLVDSFLCECVLNLCKRITFSLGEEVKFCCMYSFQYCGKRYFRLRTVNFIFTAYRRIYRKLPNIFIINERETNREVTCTAETRLVHPFSQFLIRVVNFL